MCPQVCVKKKSQTTELSAGLIPSVTPESMRISLLVGTKGLSAWFLRLAIELIPRKENRTTIYDTSPDCSSNLWLFLAQSIF